MELHKSLSDQTILMHVANMSKWEVLEKLVQCLEEGAGREVLAAVLDREHRSSTGVGGGIAIPHARTDQVSTLSVALAISPEGIDFHSLDGKPCHLVFLLVAPTGASKRYLDALASIASIGVNPAYVAALQHCATPAEVRARLAVFNGTSRPATQVAGRP